MSECPLGIDPRPQLVEVSPSKAISGRTLSYPKIEREPAYERPIIAQITPEVRGRSVQLCLGILVNLRKDIYCANEVLCRRPEEGRNRWPVIRSHVGRTHAGQGPRPRRT